VMGILLLIVGISMMVGGAVLSVKLNNPLLFICALPIGGFIGIIGGKMHEGHDNVSQAAIESCMEDAAQVEKWGDSSLKNLLTKLLADGKMTKNELQEYKDAVNSRNDRMFQEKIDQFKFGVSK